MPELREEAPLDPPAVKAPLEDDPPAVSGPCEPYAGSGVLCVPWFSVDFWQEVLDFNFVLRGAPYET
eukprot:1196381-Prorocentrum_minimum.AAC.1